jgi:hypothetical protein
VGVVDGFMLLDGNEVGGGAVVGKGDIEVGTTGGLAVGVVDGFMLPDGNEVGDVVLVGGKGDIVVWLVVSPLFGGAGIAGFGSDGNASEGI